MPTLYDVANAASYVYTPSKLLAYTAGSALGNATDSAVETVKNATSTEGFRAVMNNERIPDNDGPSIVDIANGLEQEGEGGSMFTPSLNKLVAGSLGVVVFGGGGALLANKMGKRRKGRRK